MAIGSQAESESKLDTLYSRLRLRMLSASNQILTDSKGQTTLFFVCQSIAALQLLYFSISTDSSLNWNSSTFVYAKTFLALLNFSSATPS